MTDIRSDIRSYGPAERVHFRSDAEWYAYLREHNKQLKELEWTIESAGNRLAGMGYHGECNAAWSLSAELKAKRTKNNEEICAYQRRVKAERLAQKAKR